MKSLQFSPYIEISLDKLLDNVNEIRKIIPETTDIIAVVKDNAYGCGSIPVAKVLEQIGNIRFFAVARPDEAFTLRDNGINSTILVLGRATPDQLKRGSLYNITFTLNDLDDFEIWNQSNCTIRFHCNLDTRMHRMGILPSQLDALLKKLDVSINCHLEGVFTHLANADQLNTSTVQQQREILIKCVKTIQNNCPHRLHVHYGNSAGFLRFPMEECTLVRPGIALYGCKPDPFQEFSSALTPIASLKGYVVKIKEVPENTPVSYSGNYVTKNRTHIATISIGYGQGLPRQLSNKGIVLIKGQKYKIAGNVTMDYLMVDAGYDPQFSVGDEVVAIGYQGNYSITADDVAQMCNTISYEILCNLGTSIDRRYILNNSTVLYKNGVIF